MCVYILHLCFAKYICTIQIKTILISTELQTCVNVLSNSWFGRISMYERYKYLVIYKMLSIWRYLTICDCSHSVAHFQL